MLYRLTVTAMHDRDQSCNLYTLTESKDFGFEIPNPEQVKEFCQGVKDHFRESYPHVQGRGYSLVPIDVVIEDVHTTVDRMIPIGIG